MNVLTDPVVSVSVSQRLSLPALLAAMKRLEVAQFPALRPHQRPAWHMFLVQLGALALWKAGRTELPEDASVWTDLLRGLTPDHAGDEPWRMVVEDRTKPAFLQPPVHDRLRWWPAETPDELDVLITARNHDLKRTVARSAEIDDWLFALVSLQTTAGYDGNRTYGIARMNGGSSSRSMLALAPAGSAKSYGPNPSEWWSRDVRRLLADRDGGRRGEEPALLWCLDWPEGEQLHPYEIDPWFIEVCRRVRLVDNASVLSAIRASSKATRVDAKAYHGNVGDPWAPVHVASGKSLTLSAGDFGYKRLVEIMFGGEWRVPLLATPGPDDPADDMVLVAEALARGNCRTDGFKSRSVPVPNCVVSLLRSATAAEISKLQLEEIEVFDRALRDAVALFAARGTWEGLRTAQYTVAAPARRRFDRVADRLFFSHLWRRLEAENASEPEAIERKGDDFRRVLFDAARTELAESLQNVRCSTIQRPRGEARAWTAFHGRVRKRFPLLYERRRKEVPEPDHPVEETAAGAAQVLQGLSPGQLAELRRMEAPAPVPVFWLLAARYRHTIGRRPDEWTAIIRILAILAARGEPAQRGVLHSAEHRLGEALCDGGDRTWPYSTGLRPVISEQWLAHLIAARGERRRDLLERMVRVIARTRQHGVNVVDVAWTLLEPGSSVAQLLAEPYYRRLDAAARKT